MEFTLGNKKLLKFWATWCAPCRQLAPVVEKVMLENEFSDIEFISIDIDDESGQDAVRSFGIRSIPTLILLDENNTIIDSITGPASETYLREFLSQ